MFAEFLARIEAGDCSREDWERLVIAHYLDEELEDVRVELVRAGLAAGDWQYENVPQALRNAAGSLQSRLKRTGA